MIAANAYQIGWKPKWDEQRFLGSMDEEVKDVLEVDTNKASVFNVLLENDK